MTATIYGIAPTSAAGTAVAMTIGGVTFDVGLYPITIIPLDHTDDIIKTDNGSLTVIPITIMASSLTSFVVTMASMAQDFSLRVWVSVERNGIAIGPTWHANRTSDKVCVLYTPDASPPENVFGVPVEIGGSYFINILNLTATENAFKFDMTASVSLSEAVLV